MSGQAVRWGIGFVATAALAGALLTAAVNSPAPPETVATRDPATLTDVERELLLNKIREGDLLAQKNDLPSARRAWREARRLGEGLWPIHEGLGDSYARAKLFDEALKEYRIAEPLIPEKHAALRIGIAAKRAQTLAAAEKPLEAIQTYLELNQPGATAPRIVDLALKSDSAAAVAAIERHAEVYDPRLFHLLWVLLTKMDRKPQAAEALAKFCTAVAPWNEALNRQAIDGLRAARQFDRAIDVCRAWVRSTPQAITVYQLMGDLYWDAGREREAVIAYSSIVDVKAGDPHAHRLLGDIFRARNRLDDAIAQFEAARKARPEDQAPYSTLISLYDKKGDSIKADEILGDIAKRFGLSDELRTRAVLLYQDRLSTLKAAGKNDEALELRRKAGEMKLTELALFDIKIVMTWDVESDVDMDVIEPDGTKLNHANRDSRSGGHYYVDNTKAFGPETYTLPKAAPGTYRVGAHLHGDKKSTVKFVVILHEDTPREERREETIVVEKGSDPTRFIKDIVIR